LTRKEFLEFIAEVQTPKRLFGKRKVLNQSPDYWKIRIDYFRRPSNPTPKIISRMCLLEGVK